MKKDKGGESLPRNEDVGQGEKPTVLSPEEKKKRRTVALGNAAVYLLYAVALAAGFLSAFARIDGLSIPKAEFWKKALWILFSVFCAAVLFIAGEGIHELGHLFFAKQYGFSVAGVSFWIYHEDRRAGKKRAFFPDAVAGNTALYPTAETDLTGFPSVVLGGLLFTGIFTALCALLHFALPFTVARLVFSFWTVELAFLLVNLIPGLVPTSDGTLLLLMKRGGRRAAIASLAVTASLAEGKTFAQIDEKLLSCEGAPDVFAAPIAYAGYCRMIEKGNFSAAKNLLDGIPEEFFPQSEREKEEFFLLVATGKEIGEEEKKRGEDALFDDPDSPSSLRVLYAFALKNGENERADLLLGTLKNRISVWYLPGEAKSAFAAAEKLSAAFLRGPGSLPERD